MSRSISKLSLTALAFGATLVAGATLPGAASPAEAKIVIKHFKGHGLHFHHHRHFIAPVVVASYGGGCYWLKRRALATGSIYWWDRYNACTGF